MDFTDQDHYEVNPIFENHVQSFFKEAESRGYFFDQSLLSVRVKFMKEKAGFSHKVIGGCHIIDIDTTSYLWHSNPEALIFHEMGHSFLNRGHKNDRFNDEWKSVESIMYPGVGNYYGNFYGTNNDLLLSWGYRRQYYVDELFFQTVSTPYWATL